MSRLELWVGAPGCGKTAACLDVFRRQILRSRGGMDSRCFYVLPSREHAQRILHLVLKKDLPGLFNVHIVTIHEFTSWILQETAGRRPSGPLRKSLVARILQDPSESFPAFDSVKDFPGFHQALADALSEYKAGLLPLARLKVLAKPLLKDPGFRMKWADFEKAAWRYEETLEKMGFREVEEDIARILKSPSDCAPADLVIFDGFYHFTRAQSLLISTVAKRCARVILTLTTGRFAGDRKEVFEYPERTRRFMLSLGFSEKKIPGRIQGRTQDPALCHLERNLFRDRAAAYRGIPAAVEIRPADDATAEIRCLARVIRKQAREDRLAFSDFCVILRRVAPYEKILESVFEEYGIPVAIHERKKLMEHGCAPTLIRLLNLFIEDWKREDLFFLLRSSYLAASQEGTWARCLAQKASAANLQSGRESWRRLLTEEGKKQESADKRPFEICEKLFDWERMLLACGSAREFEQKLRQILSGWLFEKEDVLEELVLKSVERVIRTALAACPVKGRFAGFSPVLFAKELKNYLEGALFSQKAPAHNCVQVYDVVMALAKEYRVVLMPGMTEKMFPEEVSEEALFKDEERRVLNRQGTVFEERGRRASGEKYFFYMAVTRATQRLILSYPRHDFEGRPTVPSSYIEEVRKCFPKLEVPSAPHPVLTPPEEWQSAEDAGSGLICMLFGDPAAGGPLKPTQGLLECAGQWLEREDFRDAVRWGLRGGDPGSTARLQDPRLLEFLKKENVFSPTRLEIYATCAFKYFASKVLKIQEPPAGQDARQMGTLLHRALDTFYRQLPESRRQDEKFWADPPRIAADLKTILESLRKKDNPFSSQPPYRQELLWHSVAETLELFAEEESALRLSRGLLPSHFELAFERESNNYLKIKDAQGDTLYLGGRIDRVDLVPGQNKALLVDYKRSKRSQSVADRLGDGREIQLPLYLLALKEVFKLQVVGAELRYLKDSKRDGIYTQEFSLLTGENPKKGVYSEQELEEILERCRRQIREIVGRLREGDISVKSKSCEFCAYDAVCRFEKWRLAYERPVTDERPS